MRASAADKSGPLVAITAAATLGRRGADEVAVGIEGPGELCGSTIKAPGYSAPETERRASWAH